MGGGTMNRFCVDACIAGTLVAMVGSDSRPSNWLVIGIKLRLGGSSIEPALSD